MPRHLISDAHKWINDVPIVPIYYLVKPQPRKQLSKFNEVGINSGSNYDSRWEKVEQTQIIPLPVRELHMDWETKY